MWILLRSAMAAVTKDYGYVNISKNFRYVVCEIWERVTLITDKSKCNWVVFFAILGSEVK
jgi:hypothetical protein